MNVRYCGHVISEDGIKLDPKKVEAITNMAAPTCKAKLQTILGMANYLVKFAPNISNIQPQSEMFLKRTLDFYGTHSKTAFNKMKGVITKVPFLAFYDPKKELNLEVDSSKRATGATLMQEKDH